MTESTNARRETLMNGAVAAIWLFFFASQLPAATTEQWYRWETSFASSRDYVGTSGNPYRDLVVRVTYTPFWCPVASPCFPFSGYGFWDGGNIFKIRTALPEGSWVWHVDCAGVSNGEDCSTDPAFTAPLNEGVLNVVNESTTDPELLERGFLTTTPAGLVYADGAMQFFWQGDTVWLVNGIDHERNDRWTTYLNDRKNRGFSVVLIDPSAGGAPDSAAACQLLFEDIGYNSTTKKCPGHATEELTCPKTCSRYKPGEWAKLDEKVRLANERNLVVALMGLMDPTGNERPATAVYPEAEAAQTLARNVAARLSGNFVIFSPSLDDPYSTVSLIDAVGTTLADAVPRHLVTAHLAGSSPKENYADPATGVNQFTWHDLQVFQSGHAANSDACSPSLPQFLCAVRRARELSDYISSAVPLKPTINGEAAYDEKLADGTDNPPVIESPYGVRDTGFGATLNGALGFTLGVKGLFDWSSPNAATSLGSPSSKQMQILGDQFRAIPWWSLHRDFDLIKNQPTDEGKKASLASFGTHYLLYMPDNPWVDVDLKKAVEKGFSCSSPSWTTTWMNPRTGFLEAGASCNKTSAGGATHRLTRPSCSGSNGQIGLCDWLVTIRKTGSDLAAAVADEPALDVWVESSAMSQGGKIRARMKGPDSEPLSPAFDVSDEAQSASLLPVQAALRGHAFLVVWETSFDGHLHGVRGQRVSAQAQKVGQPFALNSTIAYDQSSPWVATSPGSGGLVTWTSYAQDGDQGGIFARLVTPDGEPDGSEIQVNDYTPGRQDLSRVGADPRGNFVVAWTSWGEDGDDAGVFARRLDSTGRLLGPEIAVNRTTLGAQILTDLAVESDGSFTVRWDSQGVDSADQGAFVRSFDRDGNPLGDELITVPPAAPTLAEAWRDAPGEER